MRFAIHSLGARVILFGARLSFCEFDHDGSSIFVNFFVKKPKIRKICVFSASDMPTFFVRNFSGVAARNFSDGRKVFWVPSHISGLIISPKARSVSRKDRSLHKKAVLCNDIMG